MIRNIVRFSILSLAAVFLASCAAGSLADRSTGSITFAFPKSVQPRGIEDEYQVVIYYGLDRYEAAPDVSGNELIFTGIPTGNVRIIVAKGSKEDGFFYTEKYGQRFIKIVPGDNGPYDLNLKTSELVRVEDLKGKRINGLAALDGLLYASTVGALSEITYSGGGFTVTPGPVVPAGIAVNSLSLGKTYESDEWKPQVWVNGTWSESAGGGIAPWNGGTLDFDFAAGFGNPANRKGGALTSFEISYSGAFAVDNVEEGLAIFFQRDGGIGGLYLTPGEFTAPDKSAWPWIVDDINFEELLGDVVEEGTEFVKDLIVSPESSAAYVVTSIFTMKVSEEFITAGSAPQSAGDFLNSESVAFAPYLGSDNVCIELGASSTGTETIYVGTENGLYKGSSSNLPGEFFGSGGATLVQGTAGYYIKLIAASPDGKKVAFAARRGANPDLLIVVDNDSKKVVDLRGLQGLPGTRLSNLIWLDDADELLAVSGERGLALLDVTQLF